MRSPCLAAAAAALCALGPSGAGAQMLPAQAPTKSVVAMRTTTAITVDGVPDEAAWRQADVVSDFVVVNRSRERDGSRPAEYTLLVKMTHSFDFQETATGFQAWSRQGRNVIGHRRTEDG